MTDLNTIVILGAGTGLGASVARRFGRAGYRVALVARNPASLNSLVSELGRQGITARGFPADLNDLGNIPSLIESIEAEMGPIETVLFSPVGSFNFVAAADLTAEAFAAMSNILTLAPIQVVQSVLPRMMSRRRGTVIVADGLSAIHPMAGMSGPGPAMAATRNYLLALHDEIKDQGIFAGLLHIGAMIDRSAGLRAAAAIGAPVDDPRFAKVDPDELADDLWSFVMRRTASELTLPAK